jgi:hypothetical protein
LGARSLLEIPLDNVGVECTVRSVFVYQCLRPSIYTASIQFSRYLHLALAFVTLGGFVLLVSDIPFPLFHKSFIRCLQDSWNTKTTFDHRVPNLNTLIDTNASSHFTIYAIYANHNTMFLKKSALLASAFAFCAFSAPLPDCEDPKTDAASTLTAEKLIAIAPATASCAGGDIADECADATRAAIALNKSFSTYTITEKGEQAALVAYTLYESGDYKYNRNHFPAPGRPGQGTRMMAMLPFVSKYATAIAGAGAVATAEAAGGDVGKNAVLALANADDEKSFGSAAWFLSTECSPAVRAGLVALTEEGWHAFLTQCVGTEATKDRDPAWIAATKVLGGSS